MPFFARKVPPGVRRILRLPWSRARVEQELDDEWRFHMEERVAELRTRGMSEADAIAEAERQFGDVTTLRHDFARAQARRARRRGVIELMHNVWQDIRYAIRQLRRAPLLGAVVVFTLASCIGLTSAAYGVVRHLLLAPLPFPDGNRIVSLEARNAADGEFHFDTPSELIRVWAARAHSIDGLAAIEFVHKRIPAGIALDTLPAVVRVSPPNAGKSRSRRDSRDG